MGSQNSSPSLPDTSTNEKSELVYEKACDDNADRTLVEKSEEQVPEAHTSELTTGQRSTFLRLPQAVRDTIYSYALAVEQGYFLSEFAVSNGLICLADEPGYGPKLCNLSYMQSDDQRFTEDYLVEDQDLLKPFIAREKNASQVEINQLKYVCKQLHHETWGITLRINAGKKMVFHGTKTTGSSGMTNLFSQGSGRVSGMANFVDFYIKCSIEQQAHIRKVDIIELPLDDERPRILGPSFFSLHYGGSKPAPVPRTRVEQIMALELREALKPRPMTPDQFEKRSFRRRCSELTGQGDAASKKLYKICQQNPSLRVIVRYNEYHDGVDGEWIRRLCTYSFGLRNKLGITRSEKEEEAVRALLLRNGGAATSPALDNLRMSSSVNFCLSSAPPSFYCIGMTNVGMALISTGQRLRESNDLFREGV